VFACVVCVRRLAVRACTYVDPITEYVKWARARALAQRTPPHLQRTTGIYICIYSPVLDGDLLRCRASSATARVRCARVPRQIITVARAGLALRRPRRRPTFERPCPSEILSRFKRTSIAPFFPEEREET